MRPSMVRAGAAVTAVAPEGRRVEVCPLITTTSGEVPVCEPGMLRVVPEMVSAGPPGVNVWPGPSTSMGVPLMRVGVTVWPPTVSAGAVGAGAKPSVCVTPLTTAIVPAPLPVARLRVVPSTVMGLPPGASVCPPTTNRPSGFAVIVFPPIVRTGAPVGFEPPKATVLPPTTSLDPDPSVGTTTGTPLIVAV